MPTDDEFPSDYEPNYHPDRMSHTVEEARNQPQETAFSPDWLAGNDRGVDSAVDALTAVLTHNVSERRGTFGGPKLEELAKKIETLTRTLRRIWRLDEASGHELTLKHAHEATTMAFNALKAIGIDPWDTSDLIDAHRKAVATLETPGAAKELDSKQPAPRFTPEQDAFYRKRLIADYDRLIRDVEESYARRGDTFMMWITGEQGRLVIAALKTAREEAIKGGIK
jgi:hypothetical protein